MHLKLVQMHLKTIQTRLKSGKGDARSKGNLWIVLTNSLHGANPAFHESHHNVPFYSKNQPLFQINVPFSQNSEARGFSHEPPHLLDGHLATFDDVDALGQSLQRGRLTAHLLTANSIDIEGLT